MEIAWTQHTKQYQDAFQNETNDQNKEDNILGTVQLLTLTDHSIVLTKIT